MMIYIAGDTIPYNITENAISDFRPVIICRADVITQEAQNKSNNLWDIPCKIEIYFHCSRVIRFNQIMPLILIFFPCFKCIFHQHRYRHGADTSGDGSDV